MEKEPVFSAPWKTANIGLAAALITSGYEIITIESEGFGFWNDEDGFKDVADDYKTGRHIANAPEFYRVVLLLQHLAGSEGMCMTPIHGRTEG